MALFLGLVLRNIFSGCLRMGRRVWVSTLLLPPYGVGVLIRSLDNRNRRLAQEQERAGREAAARGAAGSPANYTTCSPTR